MTRCCLCAGWYHEECVGITTDADRGGGGVWPCPECRLTSSRVLGLVETVNLLVQMVGDLKVKLYTLEYLREGETQQLIRVIHKEMEVLADRENTTAMNVAELTEKVSGGDIGGERPDALIGSSLIRDVDERKLVNTAVTCKPGGKIADVTRQVATLTDKSLNGITLVIGGNDCATKPEKPVKDIITDYRDLIDTATKKAGKVTIGGICPRLKPAGVDKSIKAVNDELQLLCEAKGVDFIDNAPSFTLADGSINDGYLLADGIHLTRTAVNKLAANLKLHAVDSSVGICKSRHPTTATTREQRIPPNTSPPPRSNNRREDAGWLMDWPPLATTTTTKSATNRRGNATSGEYQLRRTGTEQLRREQPHQDERAWTVVQPSTRRPPAWRTSPTPARCYYCGEGGHMSGNCRHGREIQCSGCGKLGHKAKFCTR